MAKNKKVFWTLLIIAFLAIILRGFLSTLINKGDVLVQLEWAKIIYHQNLNTSYFYPIWTYSPPTQPPLMMLSFWLSQHIYENRYLLAEMHNAIKIPPTFFILWFDKFGEVFLIRLWEILGDIVAAYIVFRLVSSYSKKKWLGILAFSVVVFNPITLFETGIWGQNDIFSAIFIYISFFIINSSPLSFAISPAFFILGLLIKPVGLILLPFYIFYYIFRWIKLKHGYFIKILAPITATLISSLLIYLLFLPFVTSNTNFITDTQNIVSKRISPQSKGVSRGSISAFNFYSLFFRIDYTSGSQKILNLSLDNLGIFLFLAINLIAFFILIRWWSSATSKQIYLLSFIIFFICQGSFLFVTGMLERYFLLGFIAAILLMFFSFSKFGWNMLFQQLLWFINLLYAFFLRDFGIVRTIFWSNNYLGIRILSLLGLVNFFVILYKYKIKNSQSKTKNN